MKKLLTLYIVWSSIQIYAQEISFKYNDQVKILQNGQNLVNAFAGGLNAPQFSTCQLNNDGPEDLVVYDRTAQKVFTFLATKNTSGQYYWQYAPQYETLFPTLQNWMLLVDYDKDGRKDLFTHSSAGLKLYRNTTTADKVSWQLIASPLYSIGFSGKINLNVTATDIPAITDIDNDGDIDVLLFDPSGDFVEFHRNNAVEKYNDPTRLEFVKIGYCWGDFIKQLCQDFQFGIDCGDTPAGQKATEPSAQKVLHSGNALLLLDLNGDNKKDVLFGHITCNNIASLINQGTQQRASFTSASYVYPTNTTAIDFPIFPAVYFEDLDFDGIKDLVAAPNGFDSAERTIDFQQSVWFYKNTGKDNLPIWSYQGKNFLQNTMLDLGENTSPVLVDIDGDGDKDLVIGYSGNITSTGVKAGLVLLENKGDNTFEVKDTDYLGIVKSMQLLDIRPFVADINGDGIDDLGFSSNSSKGMEIRYIPNKAARNQAFNIQLSNAVLLPTFTDFLAGESVTFFDFDKDGKIDILHGTSRGNIRFIQNTGSNQSPKYVVQNDNLGKLQTDYIAGNIFLTTGDVNLDGKTDLLVGNRTGNMSIYRSFQEQNINQFVADTSLIFNSFSNKSENLLIGGNATIAIGDLDNDLLPDVIVGTNTGGLRVLKNLTKVVITGTEQDQISQVYPNPTNRYVYVKMTENAQATLIDLSGRIIQNTRMLRANTEEVFDLQGLPSGMYLLKIDTNKKSQTAKIILRN
ncbi:T9SS type A sorting domain-containing protein [Cellulophaga sp. BC115SP]|uniref:T9SS type A sorting domain-containing protein n=1 Tax=Cellulophaga sp. BC115SP TaxID=2683263 RepID=UPI0014124AA9|nr:T9SS type A sorting domain-containing protein [Cellulophaga sp. BC115SP]NBB26849.1 T9SS type A sorting domain-containing protein [Cellulophaga sp. BC115SP]